MLAAKTDALLRHATASAIALYQRRLSPLKGFSCAHRILHGGDSCSQHAKDMVLPLGPRAAVCPTRTRLAACRKANEALLRADAFRPTARRDRRRRGRGEWRRWIRRRRDVADEASDAFDDSPDGDSSGCVLGSVDCDFCSCVP